MFEIDFDEDHHGYSELQADIEALAQSHQTQDRALFLLDDWLLRKRGTQ